MHVFRATAAIGALFGAGLAMSAKADAATLTGGGLLIDTGSGYQVVAPPMEVQAGTSIIANPDGRGEILYADGCVQRVRPGEVVLVTEASPCAAGAPVRSTGIGDYGLVIGGLVVGGGVIAALALSGGDSDKPKSP